MHKPDIYDVLVPRTVINKKSYSLRLVCTNCGDTSYYSFTKGQPIKGTNKSCKKCGCTLDQTK